MFMCTWYLYFSLSIYVHVYLTCLIHVCVLNSFLCLCFPDIFFITGSSWVQGRGLAPQFCRDFSMTFLGPFWKRSAVCCCMYSHTNIFVFLTWLRVVKIEIKIHMHIHAHTNTHAHISNHAHAHESWYDQPRHMFTWINHVACDSAAVSVDT